MKLLDGKKTHIIAVLTVLYAILGFYLEMHDMDSMVKTILVGLGIITGRDALRKLE